MQQNYYIYERDGRITILPWDYGLAFGGFQSGNASSTVNFPIDTPVSGVSMEDRPLVNKLLEVDEYRERYHSYLAQIVEGYFESGLFENTINEIDSKINQFVKNDVSSFFSYEQYEASLPMFAELGRLRAESVKGQLDGTIPSTSSGQSTDRSSLVDSSNINLSVLGSMMGGGGMGQGERGGQGGFAGGDMRGGGFPGMGGQNRFPAGDDSGGQEIPADGGRNNPTRGDMINPGGISSAPGSTQAETGTQYLIIVMAAAILLIGAIIIVAKPKKNTI